MSNQKAAIVFTCPECRAELSVEPARAGETGPCPNCGAGICAPFQSEVQGEGEDVAASSTTGTGPASSTSSPDFQPPEKRSRPSTHGSEDRQTGVGAPPSSVEERASAAAITRETADSPSPDSPPPDPASAIRIFRDAANTAVPAPPAPLAPAAKKPLSLTAMAILAVCGIALVVGLSFLLRSPGSPGGSAESPGSGASPESSPLGNQNSSDPVPSLIPGETTASDSATALSSLPQDTSRLEDLIGSADSFEVPDFADASEAPSSGLSGADPDLNADPPAALEGEAAEISHFENPDFPTTGEGSLLSGAREFIQAYTSAETWEALIPMTRDGETLRAEMSAYYETHPHQPDPATALSFVNMHPGDDGGSRYFIYMVSTKSHPEGFLMNVEAKENAYYANWRSFIEFKDKLFDHFARNPNVQDSREGATFHVFLSRAHYFEDDVPDADEKLAFEASIPAGERTPFPVFVPLYTDLGRKLDRELQWGRSYLVVADFRWSQDPSASGSEPYLRMMQIRRFSWNQNLKAEGEP